jgi:hypothetical protein
VDGDNARGDEAAGREIASVTRADPGDPSEAVEGLETLAGLDGFGPEPLVVRAAAGLAATTTASQTPTTIAGQRIDAT